MKAILLNKSLASSLALCITLSSNIFAQAQNQLKEVFWTIKNEHTIVWPIKNGVQFPHGDNMEMSGQRISAIIYYDVDKNKNLTLRRHLVFPQLRTFIKSTDNSWQRYRAYLTEDFLDNILPVITLESKQLDARTLVAAEIDGSLRFTHATSQGIKLERQLYPSMTERLFVEQWTLTNTTDTVKQLTIGKTSFERILDGVKGKYKITVSSDNKSTLSLAPNASYAFGIYFSAYLNDEENIRPNFEIVWKERQTFLKIIKDNLVVKSPDSVLNTMFYFSKIRAAESIFESKMGLIHSPGGGRYYVGVWANDQGEYSAPFFPYLGYQKGVEASLNAYRMFKKNIPKDGPISSSFEMEGDLTCCGDDRGDAAMIAYGASQFVLATGDEKIAEELYPLIDWALSYCESKKNASGVIDSDTDEMEGRIPTGTANLSTSSLYYGALLLAADLSKAMGKPKSVSNGYNQQAKALAGAIDTYFGANIEGLNTYKYFKEHTYLRHWICLPLVMGINNQKEATIDALFSKLWMDNGIRVEHNPDLVEPDLFWDRGTLYAFRGVFKAGAADLALEKLHSYSATRLLGFHVPYVVEAWPEGDMAHLSAESALYARIFTEGILGITPKGFKSFEMNPQLPSTWQNFEIENIMAFGERFNVSTTRENGMLDIKITKNNQLHYQKKIKEGTSILIKL